MALFVTRVPKSALSLSTSPSVILSGDSIMEEVFPEAVIYRIFRFIWFMLIAVDLYTVTQL